MSKRYYKHGRDWHHRKPSSIGGANTDRNLSRVPTHKHRAWHLLFQNWTAEQIADEINKYWLDSDYQFVAVKKSQ